MALESGFTFWGSQPLFFLPPKSGQPAPGANTLLRHHIALNSVKAREKWTALPPDFRSEASAILKLNDTGNDFSLRRSSAHHRIPLGLCRINLCFHSAAVCWALTLCQALCQVLRTLQWKRPSSYVLGAHSVQTRSPPKHP